MAITVVDLAPNAWGLVASGPGTFDLQMRTRGSLKLREASSLPSGEPDDTSTYWVLNTEGNKQSSLNAGENLYAWLGASNNDVKLAVDALVSPSIAAGENHLGAIGGHTPTIDITLTLDTLIYATGDVLADTQTIANVFRVIDGTGVIQSIHVHDEDAQGQPFDLVFLSAASSLGTENAAVSMSDTLGRDVLGLISFGSGEYVTWPNFKTASKLNVGQPIRAISGTRSLGVAAISRGTGTYASGTLRLRIGLLQD